jgi:hypothetical protein
MPAEQKSIAIRSSTLSNEQLQWLKNAMCELGKLAMSRQLSLTEECLALMAHDLNDVPWLWLEAAITGWRRGTLRMGKPEQMDRFPTVRQLRVQAQLIAMECRQGCPDERV